MKKTMCSWLVFLMIAALLVGCGKAEPPATEKPATGETQASVQPTEAQTEPATEPPTQDENLPAAQVDPAYAQPIGDYAATLSQQEKANVGFGYVDLDQDGQNELVIGGLSEDALSVFEIWTIANGAAVQLAKSDDQTCYGLQYVEEDMVWYVVKEVEGNATYYLMLGDGELSVSQGIVCSGGKWYMTYDLDGDVSNDDPTDEETATAILEMNRKYYTTVDYFPYTTYR